MEYMLIKELMRQSFQFHQGLSDYLAIVDEAHNILAFNSIKDYHEVERLLKKVPAIGTFNSIKDYRIVLAVQSIPDIFILSIPSRIIPQTHKASRLLYHTFNSIKDYRTEGFGMPVLESMAIFQFHQGLSSMIVNLISQIAENFQFHQGLSFIYSR